MAHWFQSKSNFCAPMYCRELLGASDLAKFDQFCTSNTVCVIFKDCMCIIKFSWKLPHFIVFDLKVPWKSERLGSYMPYSKAAGTFFSRVLVNHPVVIIFYQYGYGLIQILLNSFQSRFSIWLFHLILLFRTTIKKTSFFKKHVVSKKISVTGRTKFFL